MKGVYMKINNLTWKDRVWIVGLLLVGIFVLYMFTIDSIKDSGSYFGNWLYNQLNVNL